MSSLASIAIRATLLASVLNIIAAKNALDISRFNTPYTGNLTNTTFPLPIGTVGCGHTGNPPEVYLQECTEPINPKAPANLVGYWRDTVTGEIRNRVEMCGDRWTLVSPQVVHDFLACTGVYGDGLGLYDYNGPMIDESFLCSPLSSFFCKFETNEIGEKCVNLFTYNDTQVASRCVTEDGANMTIYYGQVGPLIYEKVAAKDEPNCMVCVGGEFDGAISFGPGEILPCPISQRDWRICDGFNSNTMSGSAIIVGIPLVFFGGSLLTFLALL